MVEFLELSRSRFFSPDEKREFVAFFFFQAEDGIRYRTVTGVQTCALPISRGRRRRAEPGDSTSHLPQFQLFGVARERRPGRVVGDPGAVALVVVHWIVLGGGDGGWRRSEERRVGKEGGHWMVLGGGDGGWRRSEEGRVGKEGRCRRRRERCDEDEW